MKDRCRICKFKEGNHSTVCPNYKERHIGMLFISKRNNSVSRFLTTIVVRSIVGIVLIFIVAIGFYLSLLISSDPLTFKKQETVNNAIKVLEKKGFVDEVFYLKNLTFFRKNDIWLSSSNTKEHTYTATNYPFGIMTIYPDFFGYPEDDTERAIILLHEAKHLQGYNEKDAYEFVWRNKKQLGWTKESYGDSVIWREVSYRTREYSPNLFICDSKKIDDCPQ